jgi:hypothetical protein
LVVKSLCLGLAIDWDSVFRWLLQRTQRENFPLVKLPSKGVVIRPGRGSGCVASERGAIGLGLSYRDCWPDIVPACATAFWEESQLVDQLFSDSSVEVSPGIDIAGKGTLDIRAAYPTCVLKNVLEPIYGTAASSDRNENTCCGK